MALFSFKKLLHHALQEHYAIGAYTTFNMEYTRGLVETAQEKQSPMIVMFGTVETDYAGMERLCSIILREINLSKVPIGLHFDHGNSFEIVIKAIASGFNSVMFDGSHLPYEENVEITREIVRVAHAVDVAVEAELGLVGGIEGESDTEELDAETTGLTDPDQALDFVNKTGIDALAVAIGTAHGLYRKKPTIDIERLIAIRKKVSVPLVLHGGSDTPEDKLLSSIDHGIAKININSDLKAAFTRSLRSSLSNASEDIAFEKHLAQATTAMKRALRQKMDLFQSSGKASGLLTNSF
ncbi:MAG TPA: class II fructose-bisphosphate aldolase [Atribacter sp.]|jgi:fructose-bisphosphate aldolase class II|uniref:class II fructose-bisphosphate aldolase n=1 Tax=Atribacter sp. TaxID=2847780 RepID=UPI002C97D122|nr:class II fructose-bisphosphate aldolase [Atribacter sp.]HQK84500.1 class II fructose-bisphosphate aldolase [Atribacter sp.]